MNRAAIELALGPPAQALATVEAVLPALANGDLTVQVIEANADMTHGRALLAVGRAPKAIEPLRKAYGLWLAHEPKSEWAAEVEYWFAQAYLANGDVKRGRWMEAEAQRTLAQSSFKPHRALLPNRPHRCDKSHIAAAASPRHGRSERSLPVHFRGLQDWRRRMQ